MTKARKAEIEKELAKLREELVEARKAFEEVRKATAASEVQLPKLTETEEARAKEILDEQAKLYPDRPVSYELYDEHGTYSPEDRDIYARSTDRFYAQMAVMAAGFHVGSITNQIFILEHEDDIYRWKRENKQDDRKFISVSDYSGYRKYIESIPPEKLFRSALGLELNKFPPGKKRKMQASRQMALGEMSILDKEGVRVEGLQDLTTPEEKSIHALQRLLADTEFQGNAQGIPSSSEQFTGTLPRLVISPSEYLEAYGVERRDSDNRLGGNARDAALKALDALQKERILVAHTGYGKRSKAVRWRGPLVSIEKEETYEGYSEEDLEKIKAGSDTIASRHTRLAITFSSLFVIGIENFYILKPANFHKEIEEALDTKRPPRAVVKLASYLLTVNIKEHRIRRDLLIEKLGLETLRDTRQKKRLEEGLREALDTAVKLGYLTAWKEELGVFHLTLNAERCKLIGAKKNAKNRSLPQ